MKILATAIALLTLVLSTNAQLSGNYTIGGNSPDYASFSAAIAGLNSVGVSGNVTFNVRDGVYNERFVLNNISGANANASIVFQSASADSMAVTVQFMNDGNNPNWQLDSVSYVSFKMMSFNNNSTISSNMWYASGVCEAIAFKNCRFSTASDDEEIIFFDLLEGKQLDINNNYFEASNTALIFDASADSIYDVSISGNTFENVADAINGQKIITVNVSNNYFMNDNEKPVDFVACKDIIIASNRLDTVLIEGFNIYLCTGNLEIVNNEFFGEVTLGIYAENIGNTTINDNQFFGRISSNAIEVITFKNAIVNRNRINVSVLGGILLDDGVGVEASDNIILNPGIKGIYVSRIFGSVKVKGNQVTAFEGNDEAYGIGIDNVFPTGNEIVEVTNNQIYARDEFTGLYVEELIASAQQKGIVANNMISGFDINIVVRQSENVLCVHNASNSFADGINAVFAEQNTEVYFNNNAIDYRTNAASFEVISLDDTFALIMNYNSYFYNTFTISGSLTSISSDLFELQSIGMGMNSLIEMPGFLNDTFNLRICNQTLATAGMPIPEVTLDIDGTPRNTNNPTMGAYEIRDIVASFSSNIVGASATFTNTSSPNSVTYQWDFGDETSSTEMNPNHQYMSTGTYDVTMIAMSDCNDDTIVKQVQIIVTGIETNSELINKIGLYPNPNSGQFYVNLQQIHAKRISMLIYDQLGKLLLEQVMDNTLQIVNMDDLPQGIYFATFISENVVMTKRFMIQ